MSQHSAPLAELQRLLAARDRLKINELLADWLGRDVAVGDHWGTFADILAQHGEWTLALRAIRRYRTTAPGDHARAFAEAVMHARAGRNTEAHICAASLLRGSPNDVRIKHFMGALASEAGRFDEALDHFLAVLAFNPRSAQTWLELSAIHRFTSDDPLLDRLRRTAVAAGPQELRAPLFYALGKALNDVGEFEGAFAAFQEGAALVASDRLYDEVSDRAQADAVMTAWDRVALPKFGNAAKSKQVFVTGLPRSGTTLVEHILASHPSIMGGGELNFLSMIAQEAGGNSPQALALFARGGRPPADLSALYDHLIGERFSPGARIIDKTLDASRVLGLVATLMPDAPIIWLRRDPLDTAWSCYHTHFARGVSWSWSQAALAAHITQEDRLFAFWRERLGDRLMCIEYEALVTDPDTWIRHIETHAGLEHNQRTLKPHETERTVFTSSVAQVRRPISRNAIGASSRYRHHLAPFCDAYFGRSIS